VIPVPKAKGVKVIASNKKARHNYFIIDTYEAGIELFGTEVKSIRLGGVNFKDSFCTVKNGELILHGMHISPYEKGNIFNRDPMRSRRMLMHKREIRHLYDKVRLEGMAIVPLSIYLKDSLVKVEIALAKGKKLYDKRETMAKRDADREMDRAVKNKY